MRRLNAVLVSLVLMASLTGCRTTAGEAGQELALSRGSSLSVAVDTEGHVEIVAVIPAGAPGAGTYRSTSPSLQQDAQDAKDALNEPGGVTISVDGSGRLIGFGRIAP